MIIKRIFIVLFLLIFIYSNKVEANNETAIIDTNYDYSQYPVVYASVTIDGGNTFKKMDIPFAMFIAGSVQRELEYELETMLLVGSNEWKNAVKTQAIASMTFQTYWFKINNDKNAVLECNLTNSGGDYFQNILTVIKEVYNPSTGKGCGILYNNNLIEANFFSQLNQLNDPKYKYFTKNVYGAGSYRPYLRAQTSSEEWNQLVFNMSGGSGPQIGISQLGLIAYVGGLERPIGNEQSWDLVNRGEKYDFDNILKHYYSPLPPFVRAVMVHQDSSLQAFPTDINTSALVYNGNWEDASLRVSRKLDPPILSPAKKDNNIYVTVFFNEAIKEDEVEISLVDQNSNSKTKSGTDSYCSKLKL